MPRKRLEPPKMRDGVVASLLGSSGEKAATTVPLSQINLPSCQPRRYFDPDKMAQLVKSIKEHGILEPLLVRPMESGSYELVAGERRLRAAQELNLSEVPVISKNLTDNEALQVSLMENLQREDLNPVEETTAVLELLVLSLDSSRDDVVALLNLAANAKKRGQELTDNVIRQLEQVESVLGTVGRFNAESFRVNRLPLLNLPADVLEVLREGRLEFTKARAIARVKDETQRAELLKVAISENLSLHEIKQRIQALQSEAPTTENTFTQRYSLLGKKLKKADVWSDPKKQKRLEKLLTQLEQLLED
jgi:ParB family transcriptional regulator, chromosome partitioning protein